MTDVLEDQDYFENYGFSRRTKGGILNANIRTLKELSLKTEREILSIPNVGRLSVNEINAVLTEHGLEPLSRYEGRTMEQELARLHREIASNYSRIATAQIAIARIEMRKGNSND